ncbi:MAG: hypothetical protein IJ083_06620 [Clostridia bacterium]|nr:hypothetical protein [Clostridia bacterium]
MTDDFSDTNYLNLVWMHFRDNLENAHRRSLTNSKNRQGKTKKKKTAGRAAPQPAGPGTMQFSGGMVMQPAQGSGCMPPGSGSLQAGCAAPQPAGPGTMQFSGGMGMQSAQGSGCMPPDAGSLQAGYLQERAAVQPIPPASVPTLPWDDGPYAYQGMALDLEKTYVQESQRDVRYPGEESDDQRKMSEMASASWEQNIAQYRPVIPSQEEVMEYMQACGYQFPLQLFMNTYTNSGWMKNGEMIQDWKALADEWSKLPVPKSLGGASPGV